MDGLGNSPQPTKELGAFDAPKPAIPAVSSTGKPMVPGAPTTTTMSLNPGNGVVTPANKPVEIPKVPMSQPVTVLQATGSNASGATGKAVITYVGDGDSVKSGNIDCRIDSIDAPEVAHPKQGKPLQAFGEKAKKSLQDMVLNKEVTIRISKPAVGLARTKENNYGRDLCQIEIEGQNVDKQMLQQGMAWLYKRYNNSPELTAIENGARANKRGLWADPNPINPETFRHWKQ